MYRFKRLLVCLDLSDMDNIVLEYVNFLCSVLTVDKAYFLHVARTFELPTGITDKYPDLIAPIDETIKHELHQIVKSKISQPLDYEVEIKQGNPTEEILNWSNFKEIDLILLGKKKTLKGKGVFAKKLIHTSHCSLLFIPEQGGNSIDNILVPVDFSKNGQMAVEVASHICDKLKCNIIFHHSYNVPWGYHTTGKSFEEFAEIMKEHASNDIKGFLKVKELSASNSEIILTLDKEDDPATHIEEVAHKNNVNLIVISSKGRSAIASILIGSVAEKVCGMERNIPVLVVKDKQANMGFLDALLKL